MCAEKIKQVRSRPAALYLLIRRGPDDGNQEIVMTENQDRVIRRKVHTEINQKNRKTEDVACATPVTNALMPTQEFAIRSRVRVGDRISYECFTATYVAPSSLPGGGDGLFTMERLLPFTWVGFYPGDVVKHYDAKQQVHTMGCEECGAYIVADGTHKAGLHMINEAGTDGVANVWYAKLRCGYVLFFVGREVQAREELLTCYSRSYKRCYSIASNCVDPRCASGAEDGEQHRLGSPMLDEWKQPLLDRMPSSVKLPPRVRGAELFKYRSL
jgi:hypothetical protein